MTTTAEPSAPPSVAPSPALVGIAAWLVPGAGYYLMGQISRAATIGISIIILFVLGILVGGIRVMDPPGWGQYGYRVQLVQRRTMVRRVDPLTEAEERDPRQVAIDQTLGPALLAGPIGELSEKPWFLGQILCGPLTLISSAISVHEAHPAINPETGRPRRGQEGVPTSHSRSWEIGALYTAVAGMLNLLAIIDSTFRSIQLRENL